MSSKNNAPTRGVSFCGLLTVLFIALKLTKAIAWSWWWVTAPLWFPALCAAILFVMLFYAKRQRR